MTPTPPHPHTPTGQDLKAAGQALALEDVRAHCDTQGLPAPHTHNVWGSLPRVMLREGLPMARTDQYRKAHSPGTRAHPVALWRKVGGN